MLLRVKHRRHTDEVVKIIGVVPKRVSQEPLVEDVRGVGVEEGGDERTEGEVSA